MRSEEMPLHEEVLTKQYKIASIAKKFASVSTLAHYIDERWLLEAYNETKKNKACGVDGVTAKEYEKNLHGNLKDLLNRAKSGRYFAPPVKRVYIPKSGSKEKRALGLPTFEDKVLQRAVKMVLEPVFEQDFYDFSFGYRPRKSPHQALEHVWHCCMNCNGWVIDLDLRKYFDSIDHSMLRAIYKQRVNDGVITRLLGKWLKCGIMENEELFYTGAGTPQGGVISPLLSNIFLHEVLDRWYVETVKPRLKGKSGLIRFADDAIMCFSEKEDAERVMKVLGKRFEKYKLTLHPEKSKLLKFQNPSWNKYGRDEDYNGSFDFLGFTHYWGKSRRGKQTVRRKTSKKKFAESLKKVKEWCKKNRHRKISEQIKILNRKLIGYYGYYGITMNFRSIKNFYERLKSILFKWLNRRNRTRGITGSRYEGVLKRYPLEKPRIVHSSI